MFSSHRKQINRDHEKGASILEFMAALGIFFVVASALFTAIEQVIVESNLIASAPAIYEHDQIIRFEISTTMDQLQRLLIINEKDDKNNNGRFEDNEISFCTDPLEKLQRSQQNFVFPRTIYWGPKGYLESQSNVGDIIENFDSLKDKLTVTNTNNQLGTLKQALTRCTKTSIEEDTGNVAGKNSLYLCGYGVDTMVELKIGFWDFLTGNPIDCDKLNSKPGRGVQAVYRYYQIEPYLERGKTFYSINKYTSKLFLPKKVDSNTPINRELWKEHENN